MTAPITIVVTPSGTHLAQPNAGRTLCGESVERPMAVFALEPGADLGDAPRDCCACVAMWKRGGL